MVNFCCIHGCGHRSNRDIEVQFFRIPTVNKNKSEPERNLTRRRRTAWLRQICRKEITDCSTKPWHRICSSHFVSGKPADLTDFNNPSWIPTPRLGHSMGENVRVDIYQRLQQRNKRKELAMKVQHQLTDGLPSDAQSVVEDNIVHSNVQEKATQTDLTAEYIEQLEDVVNQFTVENTSLKEQLADREVHNEYFYQRKPDRVKFYTGLPNFIVLMGLITLISKNLKQSPNHSLSKFKQVALTLMRLRLNLSVAVLADIFHISKATVTRTFHNVLNILYVQLHPLVFWPDRERIRRTTPAAFIEHFGRKVTVIIDCFEIRLEKSSNLQARNQTYSNYKSGNTMKVLIGITPQGVVSFISKAWGGRTSDKHITEQSSFLDHLQAGDLVLADRGFNIHESAGLRCAEVYENSSVHKREKTAFCI